MPPPPAAGAPLRFNPEAYVQVLQAFVNNAHTALDERDSPVMVRASFDLEAYWLISSGEIRQMFWESLGVVPTADPPSFITA